MAQREETTRKPSKAEGMRTQTLATVLGLQHPLHNSHFLPGLRFPFPPPLEASARPWKECALGGR